MKNIVVWSLLILLALAGVSFGQLPTQEVSIIAKRFEFFPNPLVVKKGPVRIYTIGVDTTHGFNLPAFKVNKAIKQGEITMIEFNANKTGEFNFRCSVFCGLGHPGMKGKLIVQ
jgi:heme/copper-type cytochrome/quinol oxidase subunit 2